MSKGGPRSVNATIGIVATGGGMIVRDAIDPIQLNKVDPDGDEVSPCVLVILEYPVEDRFDKINSISIYNVDGVKVVHGDDLIPIFLGEGKVEDRDHPFRGYDVRTSTYRLTNIKSCFTDRSYGWYARFGGTSNETLRSKLATKLSIKMDVGSTPIELTLRERVLVFSPKSKVFMMNRNENDKGCINDKGYNFPFFSRTEFQTFYMGKFLSGKLPNNLGFQSLLGFDVVESLHRF